MKPILRILSLLPNEHATLPWSVIQNSLQSAGFQVSAECTGQRHACRAALGRERFDLVFIDMAVGSAKATQLLRDVAATRPETPCIAIAKRDQVEPASALFELGLKDVVFSDHLEHLGLVAQSAAKQAKVLEEAFRANEMNALWEKEARDYCGIFLDTQGRIASWSAAAERLYRHPEQNVLGKPVVILYKESSAPEKALGDYLQLAVTQGRREQAEWQRRQDGSQFWGQVLYIPRYNRQGQFIGFYHITRDLTERFQAEEAIRHQAYHDALTGLPNRVLFDNRLQEAMIQVKRAGQMLALLFIDLDGFKGINDMFGHAAGDRLLQLVAKRVSESMGTQDILARLGGDEFMMLSAVADAEAAEKTANRLIEILQAPFRIDEREFHVTSSIGVSFYPQDGEDPETLIRNADGALYRAKEEGKNTYQLYTAAMSSKAAKRATLETSLRRAIHQEEFVVYYQPMVDLRSRQMVGMEALVRWQIPGFGMVSPAEFIPIAEESGLIVPIGEWVLRSACAQTQRWHQRGLPPLRVSVNLSARQFQRQDLVSRVQAVLAETGLDPSYLDLEITESYAMQNPSFTIEVLRALKAMGIRISIDDFGTGYSSLSHLKQFPLDTLKIDRSFVHDLSTDANDAAIASAIIVLAHSLGLEVVAEGVETQDQWEILRHQGCDRMQGYLISPPVSVEAFEKLFTTQKRAA